MRLFTAINFDEETKDILSKAAEQLREAGVSGNFSKRVNYHLTLVFLGELPESKLPVIKSAMDNAAEGMTPFDFTVEGVGTFRGGIIWAGIKPCPPLQKLWRKLADNLLEQGFAFREGSYSPHLTLCREARYQGKLPEIVVHHLVKAKSFALMKSEHIKGQLTYTKIYETAIGETNETERN